MTFNFPNTPNVGDTVSLDGISWVWDGVKWSHAAGAGGGGGTPAGPQQGDVRFNNGTLQQYDGSAWQDIAIGGGPSMGVTDGSNAAAGQVGEFLSNIQIQSNASLTLTPGDWLVWGTAGVQFSWLGMPDMTNTTNAFVRVTLSLNPAPTGVPVAYTQAVNCISVPIDMTTSGTFFQATTTPARYNLTTSTYITTAYNAEPLRAQSGGAQASVATLYSSLFAQRRR